MVSEAKAPGRHDEAGPAWACSPGLDRWFLYVGGYVTVGVLVVSAVLGGIPWLTEGDAVGLLGIALLVVATTGTVPHFVATWWVWLGNDALREALEPRGRRLELVNALFIVVSLVIALIIAQTHAGRVALLVAVGVFEAHHLTAQDRGLLSLYRWRRGASRGDAAKDNMLMWYTSAWLLLNTLGSPDGAYWHDIEVTDITWLWEPPPEVFWVSHGVLAVLALRVFVTELRQPGGAHKPKLLYIASALGSYGLLVASPLLGYLTARLHHSAGYLGLSLRLVRNLTKAGKFRAPLLSWASTRALRYVLVLAVISFPITLLMGEGSSITGGGIVIAVVAVINGHHYFLDAIIWRFSRPEIREGVGAYI